MEQAKGGRRGRAALVFGAIVVIWLALDVATKGWVSGGWSEGEVITGPLLGLVRFHLVHNTGMAWGMFGDSTFALGIMSLVVCAVMTVYLFAFSPRAGMLETAGIALVVAGGLGNALDRFTLGYVVDFIEPVFIDFPVFNVADIGVTCGFVLFLAGMLLTWRRDDRAASLAAAQAEDPEGPDER
ncbi:signal peptidase II [Arabiibacter massiliensis]|uniref:signal peptidase II n=1 Tax=Arabiibacter massiliensis TaxID=1870985 RepID=UPI0009BB85EA|nr:signal peptidase II [Arabiibacter massiliensis]